MSEDLRRRLAHPGALLALVRVAAVPVLYVAERIVDHPVAASEPFEELLVLAALYATATLVVELRGPRRGLSPVFAVCDLALVTALVTSSGGPFSQLRHMYFLLPVATAFLLRPALTAAASGACALAYVGVALTYPNPELVRSDWAGFEVTQVLFIVLVGAAATLICHLLARDARAIERLAEHRRRLVVQALEAEDHARRALAEGLHDGPLQNVLAARQLLGSRDESSIELAEEGLTMAAAEMRDAIFDLHPHLLEQAGLEAALRAVAEHAGERSDLSADVSVHHDAVGHHDALLFSVGRELIANVARHADGSRLEVDLRTDRDDVVLAVADDGRGLDDEAVAAAPRSGHIGLASCAERVAALGGRLETQPGLDGRGTRVVVRVPVSAEPTGGPPSGRLARVG